MHSQIEHSGHTNGAIQRLRPIPYSAVTLHGRTLAFRLTIVPHSDADRLYRRLPFPELSGATAKAVKGAVLTVAHSTASIRWAMLSVEAA